ncbi:phenylalanine--tRNA ligase subunit alpha [archaeon]|jgi:phenylalanyl-tRNA synthetase alpha chain|nr:phenylalanine--tRNA ligase subunit alpha [archaeon]MBT4241962.1 phenylalanine--tRNA ligase subunit alpha [archaeon]MBT4418509.1 phenylalanine--tRNA ligase subunit alpha [archaeon]
MPKETKDMTKLIESLSPNERKIIPFLNEKNLDNLREKTNLESTAIVRALEFLSNKDLIKTSSTSEKIIEPEINGLLYLNQGLPERRLINILVDKKSLSIGDAKKESKLNDNEFKVALGVLKKKALINLINGNIILEGKVEEITEKTLEEKFLETLPKKPEELEPEEKYALENLKSRKNIININEKKSVEFELTELGKKLLKTDITPSKDLIEAVTPELIKNQLWKGKKFRRYDIESPVPKIYGGKRHFVNQATDYAKRIWLEMGFKEMTGNLIQSGFYNFDSLFTAQDHPVREMQDTFFIKNKESKLPENNKKLIGLVKDAHEGKIKGSKGWQYKWKEEDAKKTLLRTHTTCLSVQKLKKIAENKEFPAKYFALGKCFRNETVDWSHGFEFNQTEGIVVDENANFTQLLGYLRLFFKKMGYEKIKIRPGYFPYTEPSLEIDVFHPVHKKWVEFGGAGMFRPEVTIPIFGKHIPVLAWGPGFDRIIMEFFNITDLRDMYKNDLNKLRDIKIWDK